MITDLIYWLTGLVLFFTLIMLVRPIFKSQVSLYITQAILMALITMLVAINLHEQHLWLTALLTIGVKAIAIPFGLLMLLKRLQSKLKAPTVLNPAPIAILAALLIGFSYVVVKPLAAVLDPEATWPLLVSISMVFLGMLMVISQRAALSQMIGFLVVENGVLLLAIGTGVGLPAMVELGLLVDVGLGITIMSILAARMNTLMHSTDTEELSELKDE